MLHPRNLTAMLHPPGHPARRFFWDSEYREQEGPGRPITGEEKLCAMILIQAIQEAKGVSRHASKECIPCHMAEHPDCYTAVQKSGDPVFIRHHRDCTDFHTIGQCAARWLASDERWVRQQYGDDRPQWFFLDLCDILGFEPSYVRRSLNSKLCEAYWKDEAKINSHFGFFSGTGTKIDTEASDDAGCSGETGEAN